MNSLCCNYVETSERCFSEESDSDILNSLEMLTFRGGDVKGRQRVFRVMEAYGVVM